MIDTESEPARARRTTMETTQEKLAITCGNCRMRNKADAVYCEKCGDVIGTVASVGVKRVSQMQQQGSASWDRPAKKKTTEERSIFSFLFPFLAVFLPLFLGGGKSLILSVPVGMICFWRLGKQEASPGHQVLEGIFWVAVTVVAARLF